MKKKSSSLCQKFQQSYYECIKDVYYLLRKHLSDYFFGISNTTKQQESAEFPMQPSSSFPLSRSVRIILRGGNVKTAGKCTHAVRIHIHLPRAPSPVQPSETKVWAPIHKVCSTSSAVSRTNTLLASLKVCFPRPRSIGKFSALNYECNSCWIFGCENCSWSEL